MRLTPNLNIRRRIFAMFFILSSMIMLSSCLGGKWEQDKKKYLESSRKEWNHKIKHWRNVASWSFNDNKMPKGFHVYSGKWLVKNGKLISVPTQKNLTSKIKVANCSWPAFRMEFDVSLKPAKGAPRDRIGDIGVAINADPQTGSFAKGYAFITAQYFNQATVLYRLNIPYARTEWSPVVPGRTHHIIVEVVKPHLRFWVDGRIVLEGWERKGGMRNRGDYSDFLDMDPAKVITIQTYDTLMELDNLRIMIPDKN